MSVYTTDDGIEVLDRPIGGRGGARPGSGPKPKGYVKPPEAVELDKARARKEAANAALAELELAKKTGAQVDRMAVRQASATALASLVQSLRSIPDNLERRLGVSPEVAQAVGEMIDATLDTLADEFELMTARDADV